MIPFYLFDLPAEFLMPGSYQAPKSKYRRIESRIDLAKVSDVSLLYSKDDIKWAVAIKMSNGMDYSTKPFDNEATAHSFYETLINQMMSKCEEHNVHIAWLMDRYKT